MQDLIKKTCMIMFPLLINRNQNESFSHKNDKDLVNKKKKYFVLDKTENTKNG